MGIVTSQDVQFQSSSTSLITALESISLLEANDILWDSKKGKLPIVNKDSPFLSLPALIFSRIKHIHSRPKICTANSSMQPLRLSTSLGYPWLTTSIPVGKPVGMEIHGSELPVIMGLHRSGCLFWMLRVLATSTRETKNFLFLT